MAKKFTDQSFTHPTTSKSCSVNCEELPDATLMLLGKTGAGKSSLGNVILNLGDQDGFAVTQGFSATDIYHAVVNKAKVNSRIVTVVDTPGVMDTNFAKKGNEERVLSGICGGIVRCPDGVDVFLIVMRMDLRLTEEEFEAIAKLEILFGEEFWRHAILVFTRGDSVRNDVNKMKAALTESRKEIRALDELLKKLITDPILVDANSNRKPDVVEGQMNRLKVAVDKLMRENRRKYTNEIFDVVRDALSNKRSTELQVKQLREKVAQLEKDNEKIREEDGRKTQVMTDVRKRLEDAEKRAREAEEKMRKMEEDAKQKAEDAARRVCTLL